MEPKESPYYMGNRDYLPTIIEFEYNNKIITQELPWDVNEEELMLSIYGGLSVYFGNINVLKTFEDFSKHINLQESKYNFKLEGDFRVTVKYDDRVYTTVIKKCWNTTNFDILKAIHGALLTLTWDNDQIYDAFGEFAADYLPIEQTKEENE